MYREYIFQKNLEVKGRINKFSKNTQKMIQTGTHFHGTSNDEEACHAFTDHFKTPYKFNRDRKFKTHIYEEVNN